MQMLPKRDIHFNLYFIYFFETYIIPFNLLHIQWCLLSQHVLEKCYYRQ